jgi:hypothetical protein
MVLIEPGDSSAPLASGFSGGVPAWLLHAPAMNNKINARETVNILFIKTP